MKAKVNKKSITVSEIYNEGMLEQIYNMCDVSGCTYVLKEFGTVVNIKGSTEQLNRFINEWNR